MTDQETIRAYRVDFEYSERAAIHIAAKSPEEASAGAVVMLKRRVKNPVVTQVTDVTDPDESEALESENEIFPPKITMN